MKAQQQREAFSSIALHPQLVVDLTAELARPDTLVPSKRGGQGQVSPQHLQWLRAVDAKVLAETILRATFGALARPIFSNEDDGPRLLVLDGGRIELVQELGRTVGRAAWRAVRRSRELTISEQDAERKIERPNATLDLQDLTGWGWRLLSVLDVVAPDLLELRRTAAGWCLGLAPTAWEKYGIQKHVEQQAPGPMVEEPRRWRLRADKKATARGGYHWELKSVFPLVRNVDAAHADPPCSPTVYRAINTLQSTAWHVNGQLLDEALAETRAWTKTQEGILRAAERDRKEPRLYFVHSLDFTGRVMPMADYLTTHTEDLGRALLEFADGVTITPDNEAAIAAIHRYGKQVKDKPWQRRAYGLERERIDRREPYESHLPIWQDARANGIQHMACLLRDEKLAAHVNLTPIVSDIYETVADHMMAYLKDAPDVHPPRSRPEPRKPLDLALVLRQLDNEVGREVAKFPAMAFGHGVSQGRIRDHFVKHFLAHWKPEPVAVSFDPAQVQHFASVGLGTEQEQLDDLLEEAQDQLKNDAALLLSRAVWHVLTKSLLARAYKLRQWLQAVASAIGQRGTPATWRVPGTGFPAGQHKRGEYNTTRVWFKWGDEPPHHVSVLTSPSPPLTTRESRNAHASSFPPNLIHSLDAAHLMMIVAQMDGPIGTVHDSFAVHATRAAALVDAFKSALIELYDGPEPPLQLLAKQFATQCKGGKLPDDPPMPTLGDLNLSATLPDAQPLH